MKEETKCSPITPLDYEYNRSEDGYALGGIEICAILNNARIDWFTKDFLQ